MFTLDFNAKVVPLTCALRRLRGLFNSLYFLVKSLRYHRKIIFQVALEMHFDMETWMKQILTPGEYEPKK